MNIMDCQTYWDKVDADIRSAEDFLDELTIDNIVRECVKKPGLSAYRTAIRALVEKHYKRWKERNPLR